MVSDKLKDTAPQRYVSPAGVHPKDIQDVRQGAESPTEGMEGIHANLLRMESWTCLPIILFSLYVCMRFLHLINIKMSSWKVLSPLWDLSIPTPSSKAGTDREGVSKLTGDDQKAGLPIPLNREKPRATSSRHLHCQQRLTQDLPSEDGDNGVRLYIMFLPVPDLTPDFRHTKSVLLWSSPETSDSSSEKSQHQRTLRLSPQMRKSSIHLMEFSSGLNATWRCENRQALFVQDSRWTAIETQCWCFLVSNLENKWLNI